MAFNQEKLSLAVDAIGGDQIRVFFYLTTDPISTVLTTNYFSDVSKFKVGLGDIVIVRHITGAYPTTQCIVTAIDGRAVTVEGPAAGLVDGSVLGRHLATDAVETAKIKDKNVTNAKLADMAEATAKFRLPHTGSGSPVDATMQEVRGAIGEFDTRTDFADAHVASVLNWVRTAGEAAPGDGEGGDWIVEPTGSERSFVSRDGRTWYRTNINRRRYIDVGDFCSMTDTLDAHAAVQAAFVEGLDREIVFTNPAGGSRYYRFTNRALGRLYMPTRGRIICEPGAILDFEDYGTTGSTPYFFAEGALGPARLLAVDAAKGDLTITVQTDLGATFSAGDDVLVRSDDVFSDDGIGLDTRGEWARIVAITGDTLRLAAPLRDSYTVLGDARVTRVEPAEITFENPTIRGAGRRGAHDLGDRAVQINNGKNCRVVGGDIRHADFAGVILQNVLHGLVDGTSVTFGVKGTSDANQYGIAFVNMCEATWGRNLTVLGGKEGLCLSTSGQPQGISRDVGFDFCVVRGSWRSGAATHWNHQDWTVTNCVFEDCELGVDQRIPGGLIAHNKFRRMGRASGSLSCGILISAGLKHLRAFGNEYTDMLRGVWMSPGIVHTTLPGDITIRGEVMRDIRARGVLLDYRLNPTGMINNPSGPLGTVSVTDCDIEAVTSGFAPVGVELHGQWSQPVVARNVFRGGAGSPRCVYIHATSNSGQVGSADPTVVGNEYSAGFQAPGVFHASGIVKVSGNRGIGHWAPGEVLRANVSHDFAEIAGNGFQSTTVTVPGAAVGDKATAWLAQTGAPIPTAIWCKAQVTAADTVTVHAINFTATPSNPPAASLRVEVVKA